MRTRYVLLVAGSAILIVEVLSAVALRSAWVSAEAVHSLSYVLYLVAGIGGGRLESSGRVGSAIRAGALAGGFTGLVGSIVRQSMWWILGTEPLGMALLLRRWDSSVGSLAGACGVQSSLVV